MIIQQYGFCYEKGGKKIPWLLLKNPQSQSLCHDVKVSKKKKKEKKRSRVCEMLVVQGVLDGEVGGVLFSLDEVGCGDTALAGWV